ncbi:hypothetical protein OAM67_00710 [bacterium]|nr:hypothetical protein [bacterium]
MTDCATRFGMTVAHLLCRTEPISILTGLLGLSKPSRTELLCIVESAPGFFISFIFYVGFQRLVYVRIRFVTIADAFVVDDVQFDAVAVDVDVHSTPMLFDHVVDSVLFVIYRLESLASGRIVYVGPERVTCLDQVASLCYSQ